MRNKENTQTFSAAALAAAVFAAAVLPRTAQAFEASWEGRPLAIHPARVSAFPMNQVWSGYQRPVEQSKLAAFVTFDMSAPGELAVTPDEAEDLGEPILLPLGSAPKARREGKTLFVAVERPRQFTLSFGASGKVLHVFANPPFKAPEAGRVRRFGPGEHFVGVLSPKSGETVVIEEGAVVHGAIQVMHAKDVRIVGRGIVDGSFMERASHETDAWRAAVAAGLPGGFYGAEMAVTCFTCAWSTNVTVEGVTFRDPPRWTMIVRAQSKNVAIDNVKIVGCWRYNSDGINVCASEDVSIRNSFVRSFDDCIIARGSYLECGGPLTRNVVAEDNVLWCDWGKCMEVWAGHRPCLIENVRFRRNACISVDALACDVTTWFASPDTRIKDVAFEDIEVDFAYPRLRPHYQKSREDSVFKSAPRGAQSVFAVDCASYGRYLGNQHYEPATDLSGFRVRYEDIAFRRFRFLGDVPELKAKVDDSTAPHTIERLVIEDMPDALCVSALHGETASSGDGTPTGDRSDLSSEELFRRRLASGHARRNVAPVAFDNPGFEDGKEGWRLPSKASVDETVAHEGKKSMRLVVDDPKKDSVYVSRLIPIVPGGQYRASCFVKTENVRKAPARMPAVGAGLIVEWADKDGKWLSASGGDYACGLYGTNDWKKVECARLKADQGAAYAIVYLALRGTGRAWFDDVTLERNDVFADKFEPADGATMADNAPFFSWRPKLGTRRYAIELSLDPSFAEGTVRSYDTGGFTRFQLQDALEPGLWHWRVAAPGLDDPQPWSFRQTAPREQDCLPPQVAARGARVCGRDEPFTVRVSENSARPPELKFADGQASAAGTFLRRLDNGELEYRVAPPSGGWKSGLNEGRLVAKDSSGNVLDKEFWLVCAPMPQNAVVVAKDGFYEECGKRIFPLGIYEVAPKYMAEVREAGFDVVHSYRWEGTQDDKACRKYLDDCWKADGLRAFIGFDRGTRSRKGIVQGNFAHVARRVGALCDHPGLFCWYLFDEPELLGQFVAPDMLIAFADLVRELDPYHPVVMSTWNKTMVEYRRAWDTHWSQAYGTPARATRYIDEHRQTLKGGSPITYLTNCNDSEQGEARRRGIEPDLTRFSRDYDELRACAMLGVVKECNGVWWWWFARETREYYTAAQCPKAWADLKKVVAELVSMRPLVTDGAKPRTGSAGDRKSPVEWWAKESGGKTVVVAVNTSKEPQTVEIDAGGTVGKLRLELKRYEVRRL